MPDGLSKTVPIWCTTVNRAIKLRREREGAAPVPEWDTSLYVPAQIVSPSERSQIEARLDGWAHLLEVGPPLCRLLTDTDISAPTSRPQQTPPSLLHSPLDVHHPFHPRRARIYPDHLRLGLAVGQRAEWGRRDSRRYVGWRRAVRANRGV